MKALNFPQLLELTGGTADQTHSLEVTEVASLLESGESSLSFLGNKRYAGQIPKSAAAVILVHKSFDTAGIDRPFISCDDPSASFSKVVDFFAPPAVEYIPGIADTAFVAENAQLGDNIHIGPGAVIMDGASIGNNCIIAANSYIGHETTIGDNCLIYPNVTIRERCEIGNRVIIHSNTVIGADGFGYIPGKDGHKKIPQVGIVAIHDDVELGSNVSIDRARFGKTIIGEGTKIDNLVQVAHNVVIGKHCFIVSMVVFAGSVEIGDFVTVAGQAAFNGHISVGSGCTVMGKAGVTRDLKPGEVVMGMPATSRKEFVSERMQIRKIAKLEQRLKDLEKRLED